MELAALCLTLVAIILWAGIFTRAAVISTPIFFVAVGLVLAEGLHRDHRLYSATERSRG
jgi:hypothetical protein